MAHGGKRGGAGRKPGKVSAAKRALMEMAKDHAEEALNVLAGIMHDVAAPSAARVSAANAILDRGYGKPPQAITGAGLNGEHVVNHTVDDDLRTALDAIAGKIASGDKSG